MPSTDRDVGSENYGYDFPRHLQELNPDWLSRVFRRRVCSYRAIDIGDGKGMLGDVWRLEIRADDDAVFQVVAKFSANTRGSLSAERRAQIYLREINFYRVLAPVLKCRTPQIFGTWYDESSAEFLILMEYIESDSSVSQLRGLDLAPAERVMRELAALHSTNLVSLSPTCNLTLLCADTRCEYQQKFVLDGWERLSTVLALDADRQRPAGEIAERVGRAYQDLRREPLVLCHADVRPDNILFDKSSGNVTLIDWQGVARGPRSWDLGYFFAQGLCPTDRSQWQDDLVDCYLNALGGQADLDVELFVDNLSNMGWYSLAVACGLFTLADPENEATIRLASSMGERAISYLVDSGRW